MKKMLMPLTLGVIMRIINIQYGFGTNETNIPWIFDLTFKIFLNPSFISLLIIFMLLFAVQKKLSSTEEQVKKHYGNMAAWAFLLLTINNFAPLIVSSVTKLIRL